MIRYPYLDIIASIFVMPADVTDGARSSPASSNASMMAIR
jgi:hypothetical protein